MGLPVNNLEYVASALKTGSVKKIAQSLGVNVPISVLALLQSFANAARPHKPLNLMPNGENDVNLTPSLSWSDPGAGQYWAATEFEVTLTGLTTLTGSTSQTSYGFSVLDGDVLYTWSVKAKNKFGENTSLPATFRTTPD
jgi:hypothetical protein